MSQVYFHIIFPALFIKKKIPCIASYIANLILYYTIHMTMHACISWHINHVWKLYIHPYIYIYINVSIEIKYHFSYPRQRAQKERERSSISCLLRSRVFHLFYIVVLQKRWTWSPFVFLSFWLSRSLLFCNLKFCFWPGMKNIEKVDDETSQAFRATQKAPISLIMAFEY